MIGALKTRRVKRLRTVNRDAARRTIAKRLRWLMEFERSPSFSMDRWEWEGRKLYAFITKRGLEMDEHYWHYMSDVDLRRRESETEYAELQRRGIRALIEDLESGRGPTRP